MFSVTIQIDRESTMPVHAQIAAALEKAVAEGAFRADRNLPSVRALAQRLSVSPATVAAAYRDLAARRVVEARSRSGFRVWGSGAERTAAASAAVRVAPGEGDAERPLVLQRIEPLLDLHPVAEFGKFLARAASESPAAGGYEDYRGNPALREAVALLARKNGIAADPAKGVLISAGAQQAIALAARAAGAGARIALEDPTYPGARLAFRGARSKIAPIPMGPAGPDLDALDAAGKAGLDLFYCCPSYGNPSGRSWSAEVREGVLRIAAKRGFLVLEDDYLGDLDYLGEDLPRLAALAPALGAKVVHVRTFSKCLLPALRIAAVSGEARTIEKLLTVKAADDICGSAFLQRGLARYLEEGRYEAHLEAVKPHYRAMREKVRSLCSAPDGGMRWDDPPGGLCLLGRLPEGVDADGFFEAARAEGVLVSPGTAYWAAEADGASWVRIGFGGLREEEAERAFARMERALGRSGQGEREDFFKRALL